MSLAHLLIQLDELPDGACRGRAWRLENGQAQPLVGNWSPLGEMNAVFAQLSDLSRLDVLLLVPPHRVHVRELELSKGQSAHLMSVVPFLMESHLGQSVDEMHWATALSADKKQVWVMACSHQHMQQFDAALRELGFADGRVLPPQSLLIEQSEPTAQLLDVPYLLESGQWLSVPMQSLSHQQGTNQPETSQPEQSVPVQDESETEADTESQSAVVLTEQDLATLLPAQKYWRRMNLLTGTYSRRQAWVERLYGWRFVAAATVLSLTAHLYWLNQQTIELNRQTQSITDEASALFLQWVPEEGRVVNLGRQLKGRLQQSSQQRNASLPDSPYHFLAHLGNTQKAISGTHELEQVTLRDGVYRLSWKASSRDLLDNIQQNLNQSPWQVQLEQVMRVDGQYRGNFKVEGGQP